MFFLLRKELGFSRAEWRQLSLEDQTLYMEQLNWYLYRKQKAQWEDTPANKRKGSPPKEPAPFFQTERPNTIDRDLIPPDIGDTVPVEEN